LTGQDFSPPRGMRDIEAKEMAQRLWINQKILEVLDRYGFQLVEPSPIEKLETLEAKCGPAIKDEIYWFEDKAGRKLGLRFDLTVGLARMVASRPDLVLPIKLASISNMWRYDEPQYGRYRCFYQWDAEIFGSPNVEADAEIISLSIDVLQNVGLENFEVKISNRKLVEGFLNSIGIKLEQDVETVLRVIDKYRKLSEEEFVGEMEKVGLNPDQKHEILEFISIRDKPDKALEKIVGLVGKNEKISKGLEEFDRLVESLEAFKKIENCVFDLSIVRGIGYYDGIVFEVYDVGDESLGAIVAGGRYDGLCKIFGRDLPATGVAGGIERLMLSLEKAKLLVEPKKRRGIFVVAVNDKVRDKVLELVEKLRSWKIPADFDMRGRSLTRQLEYADKLKFPVCLIIGERELKKKVVKIRDMEKKKESEISLDRLKETLQSLMGNS